MHRWNSNITEQVNQIEKRECVDVKWTAMQVLQNRNLNLPS